MTLFLGVDGGGTKTEFVCIDETGAVLARVLTGTTYHLQVGLDEAVARLASGMDVICSQLSVSRAAFGNVFFGLPAYGEDAVVDPLLHAACGALLGHDRYLCDNDMVCGWAGSLACADGINLVAGTGSIAYGERQGHKARAGGWGEVFSDEGSAYWIAIQGLNLFTRMSDGRVPEGPLRQALIDALDLGTELDICAKVMGERGLARGGIAALAPIISRAAAAGDSAAAEILDRAASELVAIAHALRKTLGFAADETVFLSWSGGVLTNLTEVRVPFQRGLDQIGHYELVTPQHDPGVGAALYAAKASCSHHAR